MTDPFADSDTPADADAGAVAVAERPATTAVDPEPVGTEPPVPPLAGDDPGGSPPPRPGFRDRLAQVPAESWITGGVVGLCVLFVFAQLHPSLLLSDTTPAGGDMGAHVWAPAYLRDTLLPQGRLTGWTPDWYAGFPAFQFYMILPSLAIALLSFLIPYGTAFKLVAVSGLVSLPVSAYLFGRLSRLPFPAPAVMAVGATLFLFDRSFSIYGGNIASTLAGEFAFSISLSFGLAYLGMLSKTLETGKHRGWTALLLALTGLCHLIPLIFVIVGTVIWFALRPGKGQTVVIATVLPVAAALTAFWTLPFVFRVGYMNDMGWEKITRYGDYLWSREGLDPQLINVPDIKWVIALAAVGLLLSLVYRRRAGVFLALLAGAMALGFRFAPDGRVWNARLLPFYYLSLYLLAAVGIAELARLLAALFARDVNKPIRWLPVGVGVASLFVVTFMVSMSMQNMPGGKLTADGSYQWPAQIGGVAWPSALSVSTTDKGFVGSWADWNFTGYEGVTTLPGGAEQYRKSYPEYHDVVTTMGDVGRERGCGRAMWEHEEQHDRYGTPMALMLLPFWTDGCIGSMEGLYFEASTTTPYHFLNQDELSYAPSNAQRDLPYDPGPPDQAEFDEGVAHMQMMGVQYYMAINDATKVLAEQNDDLTSIASSGPWTIFEVADAPLVVGLANQPAVLSGQKTTGKEWQHTSVCWYEDSENWDVHLAQDGPDEWQRVTDTVPAEADATPAQECEPSANWGWFSPDGGPEVRPEEPVEVSNVVTGTDTISFDVDRPGVPVLVKASYFPNWQVSGGSGPYRVTPNFMVVVPDGNHVELKFGYTPIDYLGYLVTVLGIIGLVFLFRLRPVHVAPPRRFWGKAERPDLYPSIGPDLRFDEPQFESEAARALAAIIPQRTSDDVFGTPLTGLLPDHPPTAPDPATPDTDAPTADRRPRSGRYRPRRRHAAAAVGRDAARRDHRERFPGARPCTAGRPAPGRAARPVRIRRALVLGGAAAVGAATVARRRVRHGQVRSDLDRRRDRPAPPGTYRLSVVVPAFREERIGATVTRLRSELEKIAEDGGLEIIVVDDGSHDGTAERAVGAGADQVIRQPVNRGKGAAVRAGVLAAEGRTIAFTDADLSYSPDQLIGMLNEVEAGWDVAAGSRRHTDTTTLVRAGRLREIGGRAINLLTHAVLLGQYRDTQCGLKAFRSDVGTLIFSHSHVDGFAFDVEVFHLVERYRLSLTEVPVRVENSSRSTVKVVRDALRLVRDLFRIRSWSALGVYDLGPGYEGPLSVLDLDAARDARA